MRRNSLILLVLLFVVGSALAGDILLRIRIVASMSKLNDEVLEFKRTHPRRAVVEKAFNDEIDEFIVGSSSDKPLVRSYLEALILGKVGVLLAFDGKPILSDRIMDLMAKKMGEVAKLLSAEKE